MSERHYVSSEYQEQLDHLAETILRPKAPEQLTLEWAIQDAIIAGRMTTEEGAQCLTDFARTFNPGEKL